MANLGPVYWLYKEIQSSFGLRISLRQLKQDHGRVRNATLLQIQDQLADWNIKSMGVSLTHDQLHKIPLPAITHMRIGVGEFFLVKEVRSDSVSYVRYSHGLVTSSLADFTSIWSGSALLMEANANSGDSRYREKKRSERLDRVRDMTVVAIAVILLIATGWSWPGYIFSAILLLTGLTASAVLFLEGVGLETQISETTCPRETKFDCERIIHSKLSKLFGSIHLSEIGLVFFGASLLTQVISFATVGQSNVALGYIYLAAVPFTFVLIYYQGCVVKTWCLLCTTVSLIIWILAASYAFKIRERELVLADLANVGYGLMAILLVWLLLRPRILLTAELQQTKLILAKFRTNKGLFDMMLSQAHEVDSEIIPGDVVLGDDDAPVTVILVTSPTCAPCVAAHTLFDRLYNIYEGKLKLVYRFAVSDRDRETVAGRVARELVNLGVLRSEELHHALHSWYSMSRPGVEEWMKIYARQQHEGTEEAYSRQIKWCVKNAIRSTPAIIVNGHVVPDLYALSDIEYFLRQRLVNI